MSDKITTVSDGESKTKEVLSNTEDKNSLDSKPDVKVSTPAVSTSTPSEPTSTPATSTAAIPRPTSLPYTAAISTSTAAITTSTALIMTSTTTAFSSILDVPIKSAVCASISDFAQSYPMIYELIKDSLAMGNPLLSDMLLNECWVKRLKNWDMEYPKLEKLYMERFLDGKKPDSETGLDEPVAPRPDGDATVTKEEAFVSEPCEVVSEVSTVPTTNLSETKDSSQSEEDSNVQEKPNEEIKSRPRSNSGTDVVHYLISQFKYLLSTLSELEEFIEDQINPVTTEQERQTEEPTSVTSPKTSATQVVPVSSESRSGVESSSKQNSASADSVEVLESDSVAQQERKQSAKDNESPTTNIASTVPDNSKGTASDETTVSSETSGKVPEPNPDTNIGNPPEILLIIRLLDEEIQDRAVECVDRAEKIMSVCHEHGAEKFREVMGSHIAAVMSGSSFHVRIRIELARLLKQRLTVQETAGLTFILKVITQISEGYNRLFNDILKLNIITSDNY